MSILAQCGYGRSDKIEQGLDDDVIQGVIMSPRDEAPDRLERSINGWGGKYENALVMFDPQFYAANLDDPRDGKLREYDYYKNNNGLGRAQFSGTKIQKYVKECLNYQHKTFADNISYLTSPTILFDDFRDSSSQIALNMAAESADYHLILGASQPLLVSIVVSETAFRSTEAVDEFLDALTEIETQGFYVILHRDVITPKTYGRFLYFCYVLSEINEYDVVVGYSDWCGFLLEAIGVTHTATGWYQNLRQFSLDRFKPSSGGRQARKRYSSAPLLSYPLINPELEEIHKVGFLDRVLSGSEYDDMLSSGPIAGEAKWDAATSCLAHWFSLNLLSQTISVQASFDRRMQEAKRLIKGALTLYEELNENKVAFESSTGPDQIKGLQISLREFNSIKSNLR